jgi:hypothetical protein
MQTALNLAKLETSDPTGFVLSWVDYRSFDHGSDPNKKGVGTPVQWLFDKVPVTRAEHEDTPSMLHVLGKRPIFTNPIYV